VDARHKAGHDEAGAISAEMIARGMTMASDNKKSKADTAPKTTTAAKTDTPAKTGTAAKTESPAAKDASKSAGSETAATKAESPAAKDAPKSADSETTGAAPANYSRGEGQKPVTAAYKENWNAIFGKKKTSKRRR
jgi:hypothetical protein